ncbi:MAG TPA: hypothetical protein VM733_03750, partial [Thermoanaerobaculia bacterium]|nr:hypothetical protein [Thermoanaerobaculia bacterium]
MNRITVVLASLLCTASLGAASPKINFDATQTPLQKAMQAANRGNAQKKSAKLTGEKHDKCLEAISKHNDAALKHCDAAGMTLEIVSPAKSFRDKSGKTAGKRMVTRTTLVYENPSQKASANATGPAPAKWPALMTFSPRTANADGPAVTSRGAAFMPASANNDDGDCVDWVDGTHFNRSNCFGIDGNLKPTLTADAANGQCTHTSGSVFTGNATDNVEDDCWDAKNALKTTLVESIDEDGADSIDNDHDGTVDEDGAAAQTEGECARLYRAAKVDPLSTDVDPATGQCNMGRLLAKYVNDKSVAKGNGKLFKIKDDGTYDPEAREGKVEPGTEERHIALTESFGVKCKKGLTFVEADGVCASDQQLALYGGEEGFHAAMAATIAANDAGDDPNMKRVAMMGFTFAPPVIEWGYSISEEVCVLGICVEVFYARIGYEFDLALGLRMPVEIEVLDEPASILAGTNYEVKTQVEPLNFSAKQFTDFCNENHLADGLVIANCNERFAFPNFIDEALQVIKPEHIDGDEFVAQYSVFAGVKVEVFGIPIISWGIDSALDVPDAWTMLRLKNAITDLPDGVDIGQVQAAIALLAGWSSASNTEDAAIALADFIKEISGAPGTFTTPFGFDEDGALRPFPFSGEVEVMADCAQALVEQKVITIGGRQRPICTNMILGVSGASLGIGLGLEATAGSTRITSKATTSEDARIAPSPRSVEWNKSSNESASTVGITITPDNYDARAFKDTARMSLDQFVYYLNTIQLSLSANLEFGGILDPIPDIGGFEIYSFTISGGDAIGLPMPQHPGTKGVAIDIPVENYGLSVDAHPQTPTAPDRLLIAPGTFGPFDVAVNNLGSFKGGFDNFRIELSNRPGQTGNYAFGIDQNTDHDCVQAGLSCTSRSVAHLRGNPYDAVADDCYTSGGAKRADRGECINEDSPSATPGLSADQRDDDGDGFPDEDPPEDWRTSTFANSQITNIAPYRTSDGSLLRVSVSPFRHPLTKPSIYPVRITGDSIEAKAKNMASPDPSGIARINAKDLTFLQVKTFFEPQVVILPNADGGKPSVLKTYTVEGVNGGNAPDNMSVALAFLDFNQGGCTLTTLGRAANCAYRAVPTVVPMAWTTAGNLSPMLPKTGLFDPLNSARDSFTLSVPSDWAGMDDTTYRFRVTTVSQQDPESPKATKEFTGEHKVTATKESMTRYIGLEIEELITVLTNADNAGVKLGGLKPIAVHPIRMMNANALEAILAKDFAKATNNHSTSIQLVTAYTKVLDSA